MSPWPSHPWWLNPNAGPEDSSLGCPWEPQFCTLQVPLPLPLLPLTSSTGRPGGSLETLPRLYSSWDSLPGPSELAVHIKAKQKDDSTCSQFSGRNFATKCVCLPKGRAEPAPTPFPREMGLCPPLPPRPTGLWGHLGPVLKAPAGVSPEQHA